MITGFFIKRQWKVAIWRVEINERHRCVYCNKVHSDNEAATTITCAQPDNTSPHGFVPAGDTVLLGQVVDGQAVVTIHDDITTDEIALLMSAFMDRISQFPHVQENPSAIMQALMSGISGSIKG